MIVFSFFHVASLLCLALSSGLAFSGHKKSSKKNDHLQIKKEKTESSGLLHTIDKLKVAELYFNSPGPLAEVNQGLVKTSPFKNLVRTCKIYEHFATRALFDVVKFGEEEALQLANLRAITRGEGVKERDFFLMRELEHLAACDVFYILADVRSVDHPFLTDTHSTWKMFLKNPQTGQNYTPKEIVEVDLEPETRMLFGPDWKNISALKTAYRVEFSRKQEELQGHQYLVFSAPDLQASLAF